MNTMRVLRGMAMVAAAVCCASGQRAAAELPPALRNVAFDQRLDAQLPLDIPLVDEEGRQVVLGDYFGTRPVILVLAYYRCPMLCTLVLNGLVRGMLDMPFTPGQEFTILTVSFDPRETPALAAAKKKTYVERYGRPGAGDGWHFLTGAGPAIDRLTQAVGFRAVYNPLRDEYAHAAGLVLLTPAGKVARYFYDVQYSGRDLRLGLVEASAGRIGSPVDRVLLFCFHYDPQAGRYGPAIMRLVRVGGVLTALGVAALLVALWRRERRRQPAALAQEAAA